MDDFRDLPKGIYRLTLNARKVLNEGSNIARQFNYPEYDVIHLFYALIANKSTVVYEVLNKLGVDLESTLNRILAEFNANKSLTANIEILDNSELNFSELLKEVINESFVISHELGHVYVGTEHILFAMFKLNKIDFIEEIKKLGINYETVKNAVLSTVTYPAFLNSQKSAPSMQMGFESFESQNYFYREMNEIAQEGGYSNITGRDKEISRLIHILSRKFKNNPILVGDAGVGKTAIVEGFVNRIVEKKVPASFMNKRVVSLDVASIISGAKLRGDIEERVQNVINEVIEDGNSIVFIDEIHTIVGAGSTGSRDSLDIANILKPYLTGSSLSVIGATTADEYSKYFETDSALARRFQPIFVDELKPESAKE